MAMASCWQWRVTDDDDTSDIEGDAVVNQLLNAMVADIGEEEAIKRIQVFFVGGDEYADDSEDDEELADYDCINKKLADRAQGREVDLEIEAAYINPYGMDVTKREKIPSKHQYHRLCQQPWHCHNR